jgi:acetyl esterase
LVSPIHVSDEVMAKFPPVYLAAGDFDPLLDECINYGKRLKFMGKLKQFKIYEGMIHGFLSIADMYVPEAAIAISDSANWLKEILL